MRVVVYDRTDRLAAAWAPGSVLYRALRRVDAVKGVSSWNEAIAWLATRPERISEIQYWGHGKWGRVLVDGEPFDASQLARFAGVRDVLAPDALVWFRTCETFGGKVGIAFAERLADYLGARVAGHTYVIGYHQSGLHALYPGGSADWSCDEGIVPGQNNAKWSGRREPNTITCLHNSIPSAWFAASPLGN